MKKRFLVLWIVLVLMFAGCAVEEVEVATFPMFAEVALAPESAEKEKMQRDLAMWYNYQLRAGADGSELASAYGSILFYEDGVMGTLSLPAHAVCMPIYHGVGVDTLEKGAGHMPNSAFPIGGAGDVTQLVIAQGAQLTVGERVEITVLGQTLSYSVVQTDARESDIPESPKTDMLVLIVRAERTTSYIFCTRDVDAEGK